ncbi:MAG: glucose-6-phosphate isomerase [Acidimicrobiales bacterium]
MTSFTDARTRALADLVERDAVRRLFDADHTLWQDDPTEVADRLGWIPVIAEVQADLVALTARCEGLAAGMEHVIVMGMGGSSLFPEVLARSFAHLSRGPALHVLDTTDPAALARIAAACPPERTVYLAASKSGSTIETRSHLEWAWAEAEGRGHFAVITDPGSELGELARDRGFAEVFENRPDIGGRYAALSLFGIVPALLAGVDATALLTGGLAGLSECGPDVEPADNPALGLATALTAGVRTGHDKVTFGLQAGLATAGLWVEQLLAESLGKDGTGVVPIVGEPIGLPEAYGADRLFVLDPHSVDLGSRLDAAGHPVVSLASDPTPSSLGRLVVLAELATALTGAALGVQPFDQPDVAAAKAATAEVLAEGGADVPVQPLDDLLAQLQPGDHLALQAFVDPGDLDLAGLESARVRLRDQHRVAVSLGYGPRFLHSTGQLHKGGPKAIVCLQVVGDDDEEIPIPGRAFGFGHLKQAQAAGDLRTLQGRGVRAGRVDLHELLEVAR